VLFPELEHGEGIPVVFFACGDSFAALLFSKSPVKSCSILPTPSPTCTKTPFSNSSSSPSCTVPPLLQCISPMKFRGTSYTMTRLLKVWKQRKPSCQRLDLRRTSWVYRQRNSSTGAVFCVVGTVRFGVLRTAVEVIPECWIECWRSCHETTLGVGSLHRGEVEGGRLRVSLRVRKRVLGAGTCDTTTSFTPRKVTNPRLNLTGNYGVRSDLCYLSY